MTPMTLLKPPPPQVPPPATMHLPSVPATLLRRCSMDVDSDGEQGSGGPELDEDEAAIDVEADEEDAADDAVDAAKLRPPTAPPANENNNNNSSSCLAEAGLGAGVDNKSINQREAHSY